MYIKEIIRQHRRDFTAIYKCEHCDNEQESDGYDDRFFHSEIILKIRCKKCDKTASKDYKPIATKYSDGMVM